MMMITTLFHRLISCHHRKGEKWSNRFHLSLAYINNHLLLYVSRENEMTVALSKELCSLVQAGNVDGLTMAVVKWHLQYKDIRVENTPLLHLAVIADNFQMVKFLLSKGVDLNLPDQVPVSNILS